MTRMYDSTDPTAIPTDAEIVAGYIDGRYAWPLDAWSRFPNARKVQIVVNPENNAGDVYDCEPGNGNPEDAGPWVAARQKAGHPHPIVYCSLSWYDAVRASVAAHAISLDYGFWVAEWTGVPHHVVGADATQWADPRLIPLGDPAHGHNVDVSEVANLDGPLPLTWAKTHDSSDRTIRLTSPYMTGDDIRWIQRQVGTGIDGIYGPQTETAVLRWQRLHGLATDGIVGPLTWTSLRNNPPYTPPVEHVPFGGYVSYGVGLPPQPPSDACRRVQRQLTERGYYCAVDGECGAATVNAIKRFQSDHGLATDGVCGPITWAAMFG